MDGPGSIFQGFGPVGKNNAGTDFALEAKAAQFQLEVQVAHSSHSYIKVRGESTEWVAGGVLPSGGFQS